MSCFVLYRGEEPMGVFDTMDEIAAFIGVRKQTVKFYMSKSYKRRIANGRGGERSFIVYREETD